MKSKTEIIMEILTLVGQLGINDIWYTPEVLITNTPDELDNIRHDLANKLTIKIMEKEYSKLED